MLNVTIHRDSFYKTIFRQCKIHFVFVRYILLPVLLNFNAKVRLPHIHRSTVDKLISALFKLASFYNHETTTTTTTTIPCQPYGSLWNQKDNISSVSMTMTAVYIVDIHTHIHI